VSIQGQILNLLLDIRKKRNISFLFIAHDLKVACYFCDRIGVMYKGELMEEAPAANLYREGLNPYTKLLFSSAAGNAEVSNTDNEKDAEKSAAAQTGESCSFAPRCPMASERCFREHPQLTQISAGHSIRCFNYKQS